MPCVTTIPLYGLIYSNIPAWDGGARSIISLEGDGYFGWAAPTSIAGAVVGFNTNDTSYHYSDIMYGFKFTRDEFRVIESGTLQTAPATFAPTDKFFVFRVGSDVLYVRRTSTDPEFSTFDGRYPALRLPGPILYISSRPLFGRVFLDASLFEVDDYVYQEEGGDVWLPNISSGTNLAGQEAVIGGALRFVSNGYGSDTLGAFNGTASGNLGFELSAVGAQRTKLVDGVLPFRLWAGDNLRGWARGQLPFAGGLNNGAAGSDGFQDGIGGKARYGQLGFQLEASGGTSNPQGVLSGEIPFSFNAAGSSNNVFNGIVAGDLPFSVTAFSAMLSGNYLGIVLPAFTGGVNMYTEEISEVLSAISEIVTGAKQLVSVSETFYVSQAVEAFYALEFRDRVFVAGSLSQFTQQAVELLSAVNVTDAVELAIILSISEQLQAVDNIQSREVTLLVEQLLATGAVQTEYRATAIVLSAVVIADAARAAFGITVADTASVADSAAQTLQMLGLITEALTASDSIDQLLTIVVELSDNIGAEDSFETEAQYFAEIMEEGRVYMLLKTPAELSQGWVMNTEGSLPISEYDNYVFNSLAYSPEFMLGTNDNGIYVLDGDDDAGTPITSELATMMLDFATSRQKRVRSAYLGYTSTGELILKVRAVDSGELVEHWYKGRKTTAQGAPGENLVHIGQGLRSRYWQFELTNIDGADFEIDQLELYPVMLGRRV